MANSYKQKENRTRTKDFNYFTVIQFTHSHCPIWISLRSQLEVILPSSLTSKVTKQSSAQASYSCVLVPVL